MTLSVSEFRTELYRTAAVYYLVIVVFSLSLVASETRHSPGYKVLGSLGNPAIAWREARGNSSCLLKIRNKMSSLRIFCKP
jgi:hypothetical protein